MLVDGHHSINIIFDAVSNALKRRNIYFPILLTGGVQNLMLQICNTGRKILLYLQILKIKRHDSWRPVNVGSLTNNMYFS